MPPHPDHVKLLRGPYEPPPLKKGDRAFCLFRDADVIVTSWTAARIPWPRCRLAEGTGGGSGLLVDEELARAVRCESALAVRHWWGVCEGAGWRWRKALGVERFNEGSARLHRLKPRPSPEALSAFARTPEEVERRRRTARTPGLRPPQTPEGNVDEESPGRRPVGKEDRDAEPAGRSRAGRAASFPDVEVPMTAIGRSVLAAALCLGSVGVVTADKPAEKATVKLEIRRAETAPAEGLTEAKVVGSGDKVYLHKEVEISNADIATATAGEERGKPAVLFTLTPEGSKKMQRLTETHKDKPLAILLDGKVVSAPVVRSVISDKGVITGMFTKDEVEKLAKGISGK